MNETAHKKLSALFGKILHALEFLIALITLIVLVGMLAMEVYRMFTVQGYFSTPDAFLNTILTIVVGLEFVKMLVDLTPANTIEVLILAMARHVILSHHDPLSNLVSIACIAGLFATRRYLISKKSLKAELSEGD